MSDPLGRLSWDDLRVVKIIGEQGRLSLAAEFMGVNNSTLFRRITQIEKSSRLCRNERLSVRRGATSRVDHNRQLGAGTIG